MRDLAAAACAILATAAPADKVALSLALVLARSSTLAPTLAGEDVAPS